MSALRLIIEREYLTRVKKRVFLVMTLLIPVLFLVFALAPIYLAKANVATSERIMVVDATGLYASQLKSNDVYVFDVANTVTADSAMNRKELFGTLEISDNLVTNPKAVTFYSEKQPPLDLLDYLNSSLSEIVKKEKLQQLVTDNKVDHATLTEIQQVLGSSRVSVNTMKWGDDGAKETSTGISTGVSMALSFLVYFFVLAYGQMVIQGVVEEKSTRMAEILVSSVRPSDLMMGKIIGVGLVGLTQFVIWFLLGSIIFSIKGLFVSSDILSYLELLNNVNWAQIVACFFVYFVGGYLIYASLFAMFGAAVDNPQDAQQFVTPIMFIIIFALYAGMYTVRNPYGPFAFWCSMIPFLSPFVMMARIPFGVSWVQIVGSIAILYLSVFFLIQIAAKIYRVGILMYGKKPSFKELYKWMRYK